MSNNDSQNRIILFDGVCNLCSSAVQFIIKRDPKGNFKFAPLQSETASKLLSEFELSRDNLESIVLVDDKNFYIKSTAALKISRSLNALWPLLYIFIIVPSPVRDYLYDIVARNRYNWFGKQDECMIPNPQIERRFLS